MEKFVKVIQMMLSGVVSKCKKEKVLDRDYKSKHQMAVEKLQGHSSLSTLENLMHMCEGKEDNETYIRFVTTAIANKRKWDLVTATLRHGQDGAPMYNVLNYLFSGSWDLFFAIDLTCKETKEIDLSKDPILPWPWAESRVEDRLEYFSDDEIHWRQDTNHQAIYFPEIGVTFVESGNHSIALGIIKGEGKLMARVGSLAKVFELIERVEDKIKVNGKFFPIADFEMTAVLLLAQKLHRAKFRSE